ncbi:MAG TPA: ATP-binding protein [Spirillospora sp.]|nr:ATP-binding protein [Spirillospora sp.]
MDFEAIFDSQAVLDGLGHGVLIFDENGRLIINNRTAETILGTDLRLIRSEGWTAAAVLFNSGQQEPGGGIDAVRQRALKSGQSERFRFYRAGEFIPCWVATVRSKTSAIHTMITLDSPDWTVVNDLIGRFRDQVDEAVEVTQGHIKLINLSISQMEPDAPVEALAKRIGGFNRLIATHMYRTGTLMEALGRLQALRTGSLLHSIQQRRRKIDLADFVEDFLEALDEMTLLDPESDQEDFRSRLSYAIPAGLAVDASPEHLSIILRDLVRNAIMYSMKATPVRIVASAQGSNVQIDVIDEGYGVRAKEIDKVFQPFQRARQPQIIAEFGHGISLYLCKQEIEAMNGAMWFKTEEEVGSTFSFKLPAWRDSASSSGQQ